MPSRVVCRFNERRISRHRTDSYEQMEKNQYNTMSNQVDASGLSSADPLKC